MQTSIKLKAFALVTLLFSTTAFAGPGDGGGGNIETLNRSEISAELLKLKPRLADAYHRFEFFFANAEGRNGETDQNKWLPAALVNVIRDGQIQKVIQRIRIAPTEGSCVDPLTHEKRDASMSSDDTMCISLSRLSVWPRDGFSKQLLALGAHEVAHARGANETQARVIQQFVIDSELLSFDFKSLERKIAKAQEFYLTVATAALEGKKADTDDLRDASLDLERSIPEMIGRLIAKDINPTKYSAQSIFGDGYAAIRDVAAGKASRSDASDALYVRAPDFIVRSERALARLSEYQELQPTRALYGQNAIQELTYKYLLLRKARPDLKSEKTPVARSNVTAGSFMISGSYREVEDLHCSITNDLGETFATPISLDTKNFSFHSDEVRLQDEQGQTVLVRISAVKANSPGMVVFVEPLEHDSTNIVRLNGAWSLQGSSEQWTIDSTHRSPGDRLVVVAFLDRGVISSLDVDFAISRFAQAKSSKHKAHLKCELPTKSKGTFLTQPEPVLKEFSYGN